MSERPNAPKAGGGPVGGELNKPKLFIGSAAAIPRQPGGGDCTPGGKRRHQAGSTSHTTAAFESVAA